MSLDRLTKEIDALSYNARSIVNALVRSVLTSSSSNAFVIKRAGVELKLTRPLIYRLFKFYEEWGTVDFYVEPENDTTGKVGFEQILDNHDTVPVKDESGNVLIVSPTTAALIVHSKILYLTDDNLNSDNVFWIGLIKNAPNPKLITNSAPIPLNIRTPIFDENMSTTKYLSHESYLFPYAYFALDTLGYSGDDVDHHLAGKSWNISADESINLQSNSVSIGDVNPDATFKTAANRVNNYGFAWGYDTHARGEFSTAGGDSSMATGGYSTAIGSFNEASGSSSTALGNENTASGTGSFSVGYRNVANGENSAAVGGSNNVAGGKVFSFIFQNSLQVDQCIIDTVSCTARIQGNTIFLKKNVLTIAGNATEYLGTYDELLLFNFTTVTSTSANNRMSDPDGNAYPAFYASIYQVTYELTNDRTIVLLNQEVPYLEVDGGRLSTIYRNFGTVATGKNSFVTGLENIASGSEQAVVGKYNKIENDARFIVGSGSSSSTRENSVVILDNDSRIYGSEGNGIDSDDSYLLNVTETRALLKAGLSSLDLSSNSILLKSGEFANTNPLLTYISATNGLIDMFSGENMVVHSNGLLNLAGSSAAAMNSLGPIGIQAGSTLYLISDASSIHLASAKSINMTWEEDLILSGNTFKSLPTSSKQRNHWIVSNPILGAYNDNLDKLEKTGFYSVDGAYDLPAANLIDGGTSGAQKAFLLNFVHSDDINSQNVDGTTGQYDLMQMVYGRDTGTSSGRIAVRRVKKEASGNPVPTPWRYLAWLEDISGGSSGGGTITNGTSLQTSANFNIDGNGQVENFLSNNNITAGNTVQGKSLVAANGNITIQSANGSLVLNSAGSEIKIKEGANAIMGEAVLAGVNAINPVVTINTTKVKANSRIFLTYNLNGLSYLTTISTRVKSITPGVSFEIEANGNTVGASGINGKIYWLIINPA